MFKKENQTIPNYLSLSRIVLLPILFVFAILEMRLAFFIAYILIASTDFFDGLIARRFNQKSPIGSQMDSIADVPFYISTAYFIYKLYPQYLKPNMTLLFVGLAVVAISFLISVIMFKKPFMMHTSIMRLPSLLVFFFMVFSYFFDTTYFLSAILIIYIIGFLEEILIFFVYGLVDPDSKSIFHIKKDLEKEDEKETIEN
jgi:phosphatidylglycerophosphate synthase